MGSKNIPLGMYVDETAVGPLRSPDAKMVILKSEHQLEDVVSVCLQECLMSLILIRSYSDQTNLAGNVHGILFRHIRYDNWHSIRVPIRLLPLIIRLGQKLAV